MSRDPDESSSDDDSSGELPLTEEQWERRFRESDATADRFSELLETLMDHPDRDAIIAREMGWPDFAEVLKDADEDDADDKRTAENDSADEDADDPMADEPVAGEPIEHEPSAAEPFVDDEVEERSLKEIPAYQAAERAADAVMDALKPYQNADGAKKLDEDASELIGQAFIGIHIACARMTGGHSMGYDDDVLCGNIVKNKQALEGARQSLRAFQELGERKALPSRLILRLIPKLVEAETAIEARIEEFLARVWWDK